MNFSPADIDNRLQFFVELISYRDSYYLWTYGADGILLNTNCPYLVMDKMFRKSGCYDFMMEHAKKSSLPLMMSSTHDMEWGSVFESAKGQLERIHVLGPIYTHTVNSIDRESVVQGKISPTWKNQYMKIMETVPVISTQTFFNRILMLQYVVSNERLQVSDVVMQSPVVNRQEKEPVNWDCADRIQVQMAEQSLLRMIRHGDADYQRVLQNATGVFTGNQKLSTNPLQHAKLGQVQFIALCCNAAIEGGLPAETAYNRKDAYVQDVENAKSVTEITQIGKNMYEDFIMLVYNQRLNPNYSKAIRSTCSYIESHLGDKLTADELAGRVGYSGYYLSRVFKKETGFSIDEYTRNARIERGKLLLADTKQSIQIIAEQLGFGNRNYFAVCFKQVTGIPPAAYRKQHQRL